MSSPGAGSVFTEIAVFGVDASLKRMPWQSKLTSGIHITKVKQTNKHHHCQGLRYKTLRGTEGPAKGTAQERGTLPTGSLVPFWPQCSLPNMATTNSLYSFTFPQPRSRAGAHFADEQTGFPSVMTEIICSEFQS